jgi:hypothetical protein
LFLREAERRKADKENDLANEKDEECYVYTDEKFPGNSRSICFKLELALFSIIKKIGSKKRNKKVEVSNA